MKFGEKVRKLRTEKMLSQTELGNMLGVTLRTVRGWELEGRYPKKRELYSKMAEIFGCEVSYLLTEDEDFVVHASELYGSRGSRQAEQILEQAAALFAGGELSDEDQLAFLTDIQALYLDSKRKAKKYTPKKYLDEMNPDGD